MSKGMKFWIVIGAIVLMLTLLLPALVSVRNRLDEAKETEEKPAVTTATADSEGSERETESQTAAILTAKLYSYAESEADLEGDPAHVITFEEGMTWAEWVDSEYNTLGYQLTGSEDPEAAQIVDESMSITIVNGFSTDYTSVVGGDVMVSGWYNLFSY